MKKVTQIDTYQCDSCESTPLATNALPTGWKELQTTIRTTHTTSTKVMHLCSTCCSPIINAKTTALLSTLLK